MPRVTRAALRSQEPQDDPAIVPLPLTPIKGRVPLGESTGNRGGELEKVNPSDSRMTVAKKGSGRGKKGNAVNKASKQHKAKMEESEVQVLEDDNKSQTSSAAEEACKDLLKDTPAAQTEPIIIDSERQCTPPSAAVEETCQQVLSESKKPQPDLNEHKPNEPVTVGGIEEQEDSADVKDDIRLPAQLANSEGLGIMTVASSGEEDVSLEKSNVQKPSKRISRIEDSVEALDALEEEIEKIGVLIPESNGGQSTMKTKKQTTEPTIPVNTRPSTSLKTEKRTSSAAKPASKRAVSSNKPAVSKLSTQPPPARKASTLPARGAAPKSEAAKKKENTSPKVALGSAQATHKRVSSIHKPPFQPAKSTKPPTRATFELPGDAISRKLKEQREERLKREEEEKTKQRVFKARPIRRSEAPEVRLTAATKARLSMAKGEATHPATTKFEAPKSRLSVLPRSVAPSGTDKRQSSLSVAKRSSHPPSANTSAGTTRTPSFRASCNNRIPSVANASRSVPTAEDLAHQKVKGKEVFGRTRIELQERENARKEKEEAAKKARAEAAERGRIASRAWAEQQKLKKLEAEKAKNKPKVAEA